MRRLIPWLLAGLTGVALATPGDELQAIIDEHWEWHLEQALGDAFDIRAFHDALLGAGAIPLQLLEQRMDAWVAEQKKA